WPWLRTVPRLRRLAKSRVGDGPAKLARDGPRQSALPEVDHRALREPARLNESVHLCCGHRGTSLATSRAGGNLSLAKDRPTTSAGAESLARPLAGPPAWAGDPALALAAPAAHPGARRELGRESLRGVRRINVLRLWGVSAFFLLFLVLGGLLQLPAW